MIRHETLNLSRAPQRAPGILPGRSVWIFHDTTFNPLRVARQDAGGTLERMN